MAIERSIHTSLKRGIESTSSGFTFYSYTPGVPNIKSANAAINSLISSSYTAPNNQRWMFDESTGNMYDFSVYEMKNKASDEAGNINPKSFLYRVVEHEGTKKYVFSYSKDMGFEFTGTRPGNTYTYSCICDNVDVTNYPIMFCSSPAVCCDISRREFYPSADGVDVADKLEYINSLNSTSGIVNLHHTTAFAPITENSIISFLTKDDNISVFRKMVADLMAVKSGNEVRKIVIADEQRNIMLWIAALTYLFPLKNAIDISFKTYEFRLEDYDINGVYIPSLNDSDQPDNITECRLNENGNRYLIYDFSKGVYPDERTGRGYTLFFDFLEKMANMRNLAILTKYKQFIENETDYKGVDSDYIDGFCLFAFTEIKAAKVSHDDINAGIDFCKKHCSRDKQKSLYDVIYNYYLANPADEFRADCLADYLAYAIQAGIIPAERRRDIINNLADAFLDLSCTHENFKALWDNTMKLCRITGDELDIELTNILTMERMNQVFDSYGSQDAWRVLQVVSCIVSCLKLKHPRYSSMREGSVEYTLFSKCIMYISIKDSIQENEAVSKLVKSTMEAADSNRIKYSVIRSAANALIAKNTPNSYVRVLGIFSDWVISSDEENRRAIFQLLSIDDVTEGYVDALLQGLSVKYTISHDFFVNVTKMIKCMGTKFSGYTDNIYTATAQYISGKSTTSEICFDWFSIIKELKNSFGVEMDIEVAKASIEKYLSCLAKENPNYRLSNEKYSELKLMLGDYAMLKVGALPTDGMVFYAVHKIKESAQQSGRKAPVGFFNNNETFHPFSMDSLTDTQIEALENAVAEYGAEFLLKTDEFPKVKLLYSFLPSEKEAAKETYERYCSMLLVQVLKTTDKKRTAKVPFICEIADQQKLSGFCDSVPAIVYDSGIKKNEVIRAFESYIKSDCKGNSASALEDMQEKIEKYFVSKDGDSAITKLKKMFSRKE